VSEIIFFALLGCTTGLFVGIMPGLHNSLAMVLFYPLLIGIDPHNVLSFYIGMVTCTQYFGGASATILGIPTETTSLPSVKEGYALTLRGQGNTALGSGAMASFLGSVIAVILALSIFWIGNNYSVLYNFKLQFCILLLTYLITIFTSKNILLSAVFLVSGYFLGKVGYDPVTKQQFATFEIPYLYGGIPTIIVLVFLYSLPMMLSSSAQIKNLVNIKSKKYIIDINPYTFMRSSIIGFVCGFIPSLGITISSNFAWAIEKFVNRKTYNKDGDIRGLVASDSAHNSGLVASFIPLFCFAIPINASEYLLYDITSARGLNSSYDWLVNNFWWIFSIFGFANAIGFVCSWPLAASLVKELSKRLQFFNTLGIVLLLFAVFQMGYNTNQLAFYLICGVVFAPIGFLLRRHDLLPLVLGFLLAQQFDSVIHIVYNLYF
jgi:putative tricarboxylic transport membrane protein